MKATYYKDTMRSYMIIPCPPEAETEGYQYRMLEMNRIEGLLSCGLRNIDGERFLYYDITGKQSMQGLYEGRKLPGNALYKLLGDVERVCGSLAGYLLDEQHLVLCKEQIFYDFGSGDYYFTYYPGEVTDPEIFRFLAEVVDGSDKQAAAAVYRLSPIADGSRQALREAIRLEIAQKDRPGPFENEPYKKDPYKNDSYKNDLYSTGSYESRSYGAEPYEIKPYRTDPDETEEERSFAGTKDKKTFAGEEESLFNENRFKRRRNDKPYIKKAGEVRTAKGKEEGGEQYFGKKQILLRVLLIVILFAGAGGLIAVPFLLYVSDRERRLCVAGAILLLAAVCFLTAELILRMRRERRWSREEDKNLQPVYSESDEKDMPMFGAFGVERKEDLRLREDATSTVRFSGQEAIGRLYGRERGNRIDLRTLPVTIGKAAAHADVVLADPSVSRVHARIYKGEEGGIEIRDLNSTNGTWINGVRLEPNEKVRVQRGDEVRFGSVEYEYR